MYATLSSSQYILPFQVCPGEIRKLLPCDQEIAGALRQLCKVDRCICRTAAVRVDGSLRSHKTDICLARTEPENAQSRKLTGQIQECLETGQYSADTIKQLVFERARAQYQAAAIDDIGFRTEKLKAALTEKELQTQFDPELFRQTIQKIIVGKDSILQIELLNGVSV